MHLSMQALAHAGSEGRAVAGVRMSMHLSMQALAHAGNEGRAVAGVRMSMHQPAAEGASICAMPHSSTSARTPGRL